MAACRRMHLIPQGCDGAAVVDGTVEWAIQKERITELLCLNNLILLVRPPIFSLDDPFVHSIFRTAVATVASKSCIQQGRQAASQLGWTGQER